MGKSKKQIRLLCFLLALLLTLGLAACDKPEGKRGGKQSGEQTQQPEDTKDGAQTPKGESQDAMEKLLSDLGLELGDIEPDEEYYAVRFDESANELSFFMDVGTQADTGAYIYKVVDACKAAADDGKIYEAGMEFFMNEGGSELVLESQEKINGYYFYLAQLGYYKKDQTICATVANVPDCDPEKDDGVSYPCFTISFTW